MQRATIPFPFRHPHPSSLPPTRSCHGCGSHTTRIRDKNGEVGGWGGVRWDQATTPVARSSAVRSPQPSSSRISSVCSPRPGEGAPRVAGVPAKRAGWRGWRSRPATVSEREALRAYAEEHGLANLCRLIFNLNEFVFVE